MFLSLQLITTFLFREPLLYGYDLTKQVMERDLGIFLKRLLTDKEIQYVFMLTQMKVMRQ